MGGERSLMLFLARCCCWLKSRASLNGDVGTGRLAFKKIEMQENIKEKRILNCFYGHRAL